MHVVVSSYVLVDQARQKGVRGREGGRERKENDPLFLASPTAERRSLAPAIPDISKTTCHSNSSWELSSQYGQAESGRRRTRKIVTNREIPCPTHQTTLPHVLYTREPLTFLKAYFVWYAVSVRFENISNLRGYTLNNNNMYEGLPLLLIACHLGGGKL